MKQSEVYLGEYPTRIADIASADCHCVRVCSPGAEEKVARGWKLITFGYGKPFCAVASHKKRVNL